MLSVEARVIQALDERLLGDTRFIAMGEAPGTVVLCVAAIPWPTQVYQGIVDPGGDPGRLRGDLARMLKLHPLHFVVFRGIDDDDRWCIMLSPVCFVVTYVGPPTLVPLCSSLQRVRTAACAPRMALHTEPCRAMPGTLVAWTVHRKRAFSTTA